MSAPLAGNTNIEDDHNDQESLSSEEKSETVSIRIEQHDYEEDISKLRKEMDTLHSRGLRSNVFTRRNHLIILFGPDDPESIDKRKYLVDNYSKLNSSKRYHDSVFFVEESSLIPDVKPKSLVIFNNVSFGDVEAVKAFIDQPNSIDILITTNDSVASYFRFLKPLQISAHGIPLLEKRLKDLGELKANKNIRAMLSSIFKTFEKISDKDIDIEYKRIGQLDRLIISEIASLLEVEKDRSQTFYLNYSTKHIDGAEQRFMKDVSALIALIAKYYPEFIVTIFNRVCFYEVRYIKRNDHHALENTERLSDIPEWYGYLSNGRRPKNLTWRTPIQLANLWFHRLKIKEPHVFCVVPLRGICSYEKSGSVTTVFRNNSLLNPCSPFTAFVIESTEDFFKAEFWNAVISFKWRSFAAARYFSFWLLDILFAILFAVSTTPKVLSEPPFSFKTIAMHYATISLGVIFLLIEVRQLFYFQWRYFLDIYNYVDVATYLFPLFICGRIVTGNYDTYDTGITAVAIIFLWFHFLQSCRVFKPIGIFANIVLGGANKILPFLFIMLMITLGFGHGLWILLDNSNSDYFASNNSAVNKFDGFGSSIKEIYWGWTGDSSAIQAFDGQTWLVDLLRAIMVFLLSIYMLNLLIAVLNEGYENLVNRSVQAHNFQMARLIAEIEIFLMLPCERKDPALFPEDIYFEVSTDKIEKWRKESKEAIDNEDKLTFLRLYYERRASRREKKGSFSTQPTQIQVEPMSSNELEDYMQDNSEQPELVLEGKRIGDKGASTLVDSLNDKPNHNLIKLNLKGNNLSDQGINSIAKFLRHNDTIKDLDLGNNNIGSAGTAALTDSLERNKTLTKLDLGGNSINFNRVHSLDKAIEYINDLNLKDNMIGEAGARVLANGLKNNKSVTKIDLTSNGIGEAGIRDLADMLKYNNTITELILAGNEFGNEGAIALAEGLKQNNSIKKIDLSECGIGNKGARALADIHFNDTSVESINLQSNNIGIEGAVDLLKLRSNKPKPVNVDLGGTGHNDLITFLKGENCTTLNLSGDHFGGGIAAALAFCLSNGSTLVDLNISSNQIDDEGGCALADSLKKNSTLQNFDISYNNLGDESAISLAECLKENSTIVRLNIRGNTISPRVINELKRTEPRILL